MHFRVKTMNYQCRNFSYQRFPVRAIKQPANDCDLLAPYFSSAVKKAGKMSLRFLSLFFRQALIPSLLEDVFRTSNKSKRLLYICLKEDHSPSCGKQRHTTERGRRMHKDTPPSQIWDSVLWSQSFWLEECSAKA